MNTNDIVDAQAEALGMIMIYPKLLNCCYLTSTHFQGPYKIIYDLIKKSITDNGSVMFDQLAKDGADIDLVCKCQDSVLHSDVNRFNDLQGYILKRFKKDYVLKLAEKLGDGKIDIQEYLLKSMQILRSNQANQYLISAKKMMSSVTEKDKIIKLNWFPRLSEKLDHYKRDFMILAGSTGSGKTAFALNLLLDLSTRYECLYFNMEMSEKKLFQRMLGTYSGIPIRHMRDYASLDKKTIEEIQNAAVKIGSRKIKIISESCSIKKIINEVAGFNSKGHFIVFIDHIGLISSNDRNSYERMNSIAKGLRRISLDFDCTIIGLCQVNRRAEEAETPSLSLLRDSGEIEQSARKVIFVWNRDDEDMIVIEKNDSGAKARIDMNFNREVLRFSEA